MKINLKKTIAAVAVVLGFSAVSAEGLSVGGYFRTGAAFDVGSDAGKPTVEYAEGNYYGGGDRLRLSIKYEGENAGVTFRYQNKATGNYFDAANVKWAMGYANLFDGLVVAEAGLLKDNYTSSDGWEGYNFSDYTGQTKGLGLVILPFEGLALQSTFLIDGDYADYGDLTLNAKYSYDAFALAGGYKFSGEAFAYFGLSAIENLTANFEMKYVKDDTLDFVEDIAYAFTDSFEVGILAYEKFGDDDPQFELNPHAMYTINETYAVSAESYITIPTEENAKVSYTVTPALWISVSKATVSTFYTLTKDGDEDFTHKIGAGIKVGF